MEEEFRLKKISKASHKYLIDVVCAFIESQYSWKNEDIVLVCNALIQLFPSLEINGGIVSGTCDISFLILSNTVHLFQDALFKPQGKGPKGCIYDKMKNRNRNKPAMNVQDDDIDNLCKFLKDCVLPEAKTALIKKLEETSDIRRELKRKGNKIVIEAGIRLFVLDPELVCLLNLYHSYKD